jgi:hypothetical protein
MAVTATIGNGGGPRSASIALHMLQDSMKVDGSHRLEATCHAIDHAMSQVQSILRLARAVPYCFGNLKAVHDGHAYVEEEDVTGLRLHLK